MNKTSPASKQCSKECSKQCSKQWLVKTRIGKLYLVASDKGLQSVSWEKQAVPMAKSLDGPGSDIRILARAEKQLDEYVSGKRKTFDLPLDVSGTAFQQQVWKALGKIPYGTTCSYKDIATRIHNKKAVRAVGSANGKNPLCIIVPCHRVIAADGTPGGYSGGLKIKKLLLALEQPVN